MSTALKPILLLCALLALAGCGGDSGSDRPNEEASLLLDFTPNGVHAGIYLATSRGFDDAEGVTLDVRAPSASTDALRLLQGGRADMAILDIHDLGLARETGSHPPDIVGVMAVVQRPLASVLAQPEVRRPRDLEGSRVGVTGLASDVAVLRSVVAGDGGDPSRVRTTTIGFEAVKALVAGRVDGATAFWNVEGVALREQRPDMREFRVDDFGAPAYPELVLCVTRDTLEEKRDVIAATIRALQRGYTQTQNDPESAVTALVDADSGLDREAAQAQLDAVAPAFTAGARAYGELREDVLREWAAWDVEFGILKEQPEVGEAFDTSLVGPVANP
ncbi:MAG TPA: ABC transporter substrate-binding protein [Solirubrobacteraceae bacterium]|nr:ABC transporter substrate-binding protein [Solirubrobacteraceae bacterium]